ncbi:MAG: hypothetical protein HY279_14495 [Nitrospinae bacterium]|nr:hypothetical protein [Nitrospinota bacterium]
MKNFTKNKYSSKKPLKENANNRLSLLQGYSSWGFPLNIFNESGMALITGLLIMVILIIMGGAAITFTIRDLNYTKNYEENIQALYAAEAGAEKVYDAFMQGDTNNDGVVNISDTANANNDLDSNGIIDFMQVFTNKTDIASSSNRIEVNSGNIRAYIWVDASGAPTVITIYSRGNPDGTNNQREVALTITATGKSIINGALNNST